MRFLSVWHSLTLSSYVTIALISKFMCLISFSQEVFSVDIMVLPYRTGT